MKSRLPFMGVCLSVLLFAVLGVYHSASARENPSANLTEMIKTNGVIYDADPNRMLYADADGQIYIQDLLTDQRVFIGTGLDGRYGSGSLFEGGAIFTARTGDGDTHIFEWRNGARIDFGPSYTSLQVAGDYALYSLRENYSRRPVIRNLAEGISVDIGSNGSVANVSDVSEYGDVIYSSNGVIGRYKDGVYTALTPSGQNGGPITDGHSVLYTSRDADNTRNLRLVTFDGHEDRFIASFGLSGIAQYAINNGWISYVEPSSPTAKDSYDLVIISPDGQKQTIVREAFRIQIVGTSETGEVVFKEGTKTFIAKFGLDGLFKLTDSIEEDKRGQYVDGHWFFIEEHTLYSVDTSFYVPVGGIYFDSEEIGVPGYIGHEYEMEPKFQPGKVSNWDVSWTSSNVDVARIYSRDIAIIDSEGKTEVTATSADGGHQATVTLHAYRPVGSVIIPETMTLSHPSSKKIVPEILPVSAWNKNVSWVSSNPDVVTVDPDGTVRTVSLGEATITVFAEGGNRKDTMAVTVVSSPEEIPVDLTGLGFVVSGKDYPADIDEARRTITVTLPSALFKSYEHNLTHVRVNATVNTNQLELTIGGQTQTLSFQAESQLYTAQEVFGTVNDPENDGISVCTCQKIIEQFPQFIIVLSDASGNRSTKTYTLALQFGG